MTNSLLDIAPEAKTKKTKAIQNNLQQSSLCPICGSAIFVSLKLHSMLCYEYRRIPSFVKTALKISREINKFGWTPQGEGLINQSELSKPLPEDLFYFPPVVSTKVPDGISAEVLFEKMTKIFIKSGHKIVISECRECHFPRGFILSENGKVEFDYLCTCGNKPLMPISSKMESLKLWISRNIEKAKNLLSQEYEIIKKGFPELSHLCFAGGVANAPEGSDVRPDESACKAPDSPNAPSSGEKP